MAETVKKPRSSSKKVIKKVALKPNKTVSKSVIVPAKKKLVTSAEQITAEELEMLNSQKGLKNLLKQKKINIKKQKKSSKI